MLETQKPARVQEVNIESISANPHNPRRLFDKEPMQVLKESIKKLGVLVPITIYEEAANNFILLDGERRWRCVIALALKSIPAIIVEKPTETQNILTMFHIHNIRESWQLMPTALKLKTLITQFKSTNERELNELTKLSISQIRRCKILLSYPKHFHNLMLAPLSKRMKTDFFIELDRIRRPARHDRLKPWISRGDSNCIEILLNKFMNKVIVSVTEFRRIAEIYRACQIQNKIKLFETQFEKFLSIDDMAIIDFHVPGATFAIEAKEMNRSALRLFKQIENIDINNISTDIKLISILKHLSLVINKKLEDALLMDTKDVEDIEN